MSNIFSDLIDAYLTDSLNAEKEAAFLEMLNNPENRTELGDILRKKMDGHDFAIITDDNRKASNLSRLHKRINELNTESDLAVPRIHLLKNVWFRRAVAVASFITLGAGTYFWIADKNSEQALTNNTNDSKQLQTDVPPGREKAVLTLADGTKIALDGAANGNLAQQGSVQVIKLDNGRVAYNVEQLANKDIMWNTMSTPAGGQYRIRLSDGTKVWLNAASSITYPAAFTSTYRQVKITGEVYFEVEKNKEKPFIVDIDGKSTVEVLGTSFNINSYANETSINTSLLEGSVKIVKGEQSVVLKPGQQAIQITGTNAVATPSNAQIKVVSADVDQALAWKNGLFSFNDTDLRSVMRQLERWYDIKVEYEGGVPDVILKGKMYRNVNLSVVLEFLKAMGIKLRVKEKTIVIL